MKSMNRLLTIALVSLLALPVVACANNDAPAQQDGQAKFEKRMTQAEAQKLLSDLQQAGPVCRTRIPTCSYSSPDADGIVVFEAMVDCATVACPLLDQEQCN
jgi:hypothetical protein